MREWTQSPRGTVHVRPSRTAIVVGLKKSPVHSPETSGERRDRPSLQCPRPAARAGRSAGGRHQSSAQRTWSSVRLLRPASCRSHSASAGGRPAGGASRSAGCGSHPACHRHQSAEEDAVRRVREIIRPKKISSGVMLEPSGVVLEPSGVVLESFGVMLGSSG